MYRSLFVLLSLALVFIFAGVCAKPLPVKVSHVKQIIKTDSSKISLRQFDAGALEKYANDKNFQYTDSAKRSLSLWERFWMWVWQFIGNIINRISAGKTTWAVFKWGLMAVATGALIYIVLKVMGVDVINVLRGKSKSIEVPYSESLENIHEINFDTEIDKAISNTNYRLAVRLLYLRCLKQLNDAQLIHWKIEKTNSNYVNELTDADIRQFFSLLTTRFEYTWYGDFPVDGQSFQNINALFIDFKKQLP